MCNGFPVRKLNDPGDHVTSSELNGGHYLDVYLQRVGSEDSFYSVVVDLDEVGIEDEAAILVELDPSVQQRLAAINRDRMLRRAA